MAMFALGNVETSQATNFTEAGEKEKAVAKYKDALATHTQVVKLWETTLGPKHHKTGDAYHKIGWHLHRQKEYTAAL